MWRSGCETPSLVVLAHSAPERCLLIHRRPEWCLFRFLWPSLPSAHCVIDYSGLSSPPGYFLWRLSYLTDLRSAAVVALMPSVSICPSLTFFQTDTVTRDEPVFSVLLYDILIIVLRHTWSDQLQNLTCHRVLGSHVYGNIKLWSSGCLTLCFTKMLQRSGAAACLLLIN